MDRSTDDRMWRPGGVRAAVARRLERAAGQPDGAGALRGQETIVGQDVLLERLLVALLARGHILVEGVPGLAKTLAVKSLAAAIGGQFHRVQFTPDLVPADLVGTRIYHQQQRRVPGLARPGVHQPAAGRRDQPGAGEGAERAARGDAGAAGHDRPGDPPRAPAVPGDGHAEPDRVGGHLSPARGAGRPVHDEGARRLPERHRGVRDRRAGDRAAAGDAARSSTPSGSSRCSAQVDAGLRRPGADRVLGAAGQRHPRAGRRRARRPGRATSASAPARGPRST